MRRLRMTLRAGPATWAPLLTFHSMLRAPTRAAYLMSLHTAVLAPLCLGGQTERAALAGDISGRRIVASTGGWHAPSHRPRWAEPFPHVHRCGHAHCACCTASRTYRAGIPFYRAPARAHARLHALRGHRARHNNAMNAKREEGLYAVAFFATSMQDGRYCPAKAWRATHLFINAVRHVRETLTQPSAPIAIASPLSCAALLLPPAQASPRPGRKTHHQHAPAHTFAGHRFPVYCTHHCAALTRMPPAGRRLRFLLLIPYRTCWACGC